MRYTVKSPLRTQGRLFKVGSEIELAEHLAADLVRRGRLERVTVDDAPSEVKAPEIKAPAAEVAPLPPPAIDPMFAAPAEVPEAPAVPPEGDAQSGVEFDVQVGDDEPKADEAAFASDEPRTTRRGRKKS